MLPVPKINIAEFVEIASAKMKIDILAGADGLTKREIVSNRIQKLGLALAGFPDYIHPGRIQIIGKSEVSYLSQFSRKVILQKLEKLDFDKICCILVTKNLEPHKELIEIAERKDLPLLKTDLVSSDAISKISLILQEILAPQAVLHGVLLAVFGTGVLFIGESGIGKSECALDLITRGHCLISDDTVIIKRVGDNIFGETPEITAEHLEIRGLGIINIKDLFGVSAVGKTQQINLCIELIKWNNVLEVERLGLETKKENILGIEVSKFVLPLSSGRNLSTLVETAVRIYLLKTKGYDAAKLFVEKHSAILNENL